MDISGLSSGLPSGFSAKNPVPAFAQVRAMTESRLISLLPSPNSPGLGDNLDIYAAVGMQNMGLLAGGRMAMQLANISLGIDMSEAARNDAGDAQETGEDVGAGTTDPTGSTTEPDRQPPNILDEILKESGFVKAPENPYVVQKDFFAGQDNSPAVSPSQYFSNQGLSNPSLGGLINSLG